MTLDQLRYFLETARTQHLNRAALSLNISPSAVSSAIASLESEYGCKLFERDGKRIKLTSKGQFLKNSSEKLFDQTNSIAVGLRGEQAEFSGTFKLAGSHYLAIHVLSDVWSTMQSQYSKLSVEIGSMATHRVISDVLAGEIDGGLCMSPLAHPEIRATEVYKGQMYLAARRNHPIFKKPTHEQMEMLSSFPALMHKPVVGVDLCDNHPMFAKFKVAPNVRCFWDSDDVALRILKRSDSWTMLPDFVIEHHKADLGALKAPKGWDAPISVAYINRLHRQTNSVHEILISKLKDYAGFKR